MTLQNRFVLLGLTAIAVGGFVYSQIFIHEKNRKDLREIARELAISWKERLDLNEKQTSILEDIIIEFTIRKNNIINSDAPSQAKIQKLQKIQRREHRNLRKLLDDTKFDAYLGVNKNIPNKLMDSLSAI
ncbi:MAG TPA: hypothetical protein VLN46_05685 [Gillisia sp.]|nr:hypothetical protein [Gillisia sp.]